MIKSRNLVAAGAKRHLFFERPDRGLPGQILQSGSGMPVRQNDWWNIHEMSSLPYYVLVMMQEGGRGFFRDEKGFECQLEFGHFLLISPGVKRLYGPGKDDHWSELSIAFRGSIFDLHSKCGVFDAHQPVWRLERPAVWTRRLHALLEAPRPVNEVGIARETADFLRLLLGMLEKATPVVKHVPSSDWFTRACVMLTADLSRKTDYRQVAEELGMSYNTFRHYFTQRAGMPPSRYRDSQRIKVACDFLKNTRKPHREIAFYLGYSSEQHFSAHFKEWMQMAPRAYRKQHGRKSS